jgi:hypothetical protein
MPNRREVPGLAHCAPPAAGTLPQMSAPICRNSLSYWATKWELGLSNERAEWVYFAVRFGVEERPLSAQLSRPRTRSAMSALRRYC